MLITLSEQHINFDEERFDVFRKLKDRYNTVASIVVDDGEKVAIRIRAAGVLVSIAQTLRLFLRDEERFDALAREVKEIGKKLEKRQSKRRRN